MQPRISIDAAQGVYTVPCSSADAHAEKPVITAGERARKREIASYLSAASLPVEEYRKGKHDEPSSIAPPSLCKDPNLTALCQLAAFRTDSDRCFLSLINGEHQYIVAEATRSHSLVKNAHKNEGDNIYLGVQKLDIYFGVCPNTMELFTDETGNLRIDTGNIHADNTRYIIRDFQAEEHYRTSPYVTGFPYMRSYAEVPLISPLGYCIGSICVVDNKLRDFGDETVQDLNEVATAIMAHLELVRIKNNRARSEMLVEGLARFMEQKPSQPHKREGHIIASREGSIASPIVPHSNENTSRDVSIDTGNNSSSTGPTGVQGPQHVRPSTVCTPSDSSVATQATTVFSASSEGSETPVTPLSPTIPLEESILSDTAKEMDMRTEGVAKTYSDSVPASKSNGEKEHISPSFESSKVELALSRAAELIRTSMGLDGVSFVDAYPRSFASRSNHPSPGEQLTNPFQVANPDEIEVDSDAALWPAAVIAKSTRDMDRHRGTEDLTNPAEQCLQRLIRRYPLGHVFSADEEGPIEEKYSPGKKLSNSPERNHLRRGSDSRFDVEQLFRWMKRARSFMFLPLWHFHRECWFSAIFAWVEDSTLAFDTNDLTYLRAFGNSVMVEVNRCEALAVSRAKSDFISSVSHELRSPLHGILASTELLREGLSRDSEHRAMLDMIDNCGQTLLDTMNHLLDFAKINNLAKPAPRPAELPENDVVPENPDRQKDCRLSVESPTNLSDLVQDVVEAVYLGHSSKVALHSNIATSKAQGALPIEGSPQRETAVLVTLNIEKCENWVVNVDVGAWKRIVMNLLGNALKYTITGTIGIGLRFVRRSDWRGRDRNHVYFFVKDTGIGISPEYLKYHLFTPFAQENTLSPGTGLGLSIVHQIVKSLGGKLDIQSQTGIGTQARVYVPAEPFIAAPQAMHNLSPDSERKLKGRSLYILKPVEHPGYHETAIHMQTIHSKRYHALCEAVEAILNKWLDMVILSSVDGNIPEADYYIADSSILGDHNPEDLLKIPIFTNKRLLLLSYRPPKISERNTTLAFLRHPIGPRKLATALLHASVVPYDMPEVVQQDSRSQQLPNGLVDGQVAAGELRVDRSDQILTSLTHRLPEDSVLGVEQTKQASSNVFPGVPNANSAPQADVSNSPSSKAADKPLPPPACATSTSQNTRNLRLLLVDDNPINLKLLSTLAKRLDCDFATATNGQEAVEIYKSSPLFPSPSAVTLPIRAFDFVFMDINMPALNGFEATRQIRKWERDRGLKPAKIVAFTGLGSEASKQEAFASGMEIFLVKPVRLADVKALLFPEENVAEAGYSAAPVPCTTSEVEGS